MTQDRESGAAANAWGRTTARRIAERLGAKPLSQNSNEAILDGQRVVIKCAQIGTGMIGVTHRMLPRLDAVIAALQNDDGSFDLWSLSPQAVQGKMTPTKSTGASKGRVGMVKTSVFTLRGSSMGRVVIEP